MNTLADIWKDVLAIADRYDIDPVRLMTVFVETPPEASPTLEQVIANATAVKPPTVKVPEIYTDEEHDAIDDLLDQYSISHQGGTPLQDEYAFREAARYWLTLPKRARRTSRECYEEIGVEMPQYSKALSNFMRTIYGGGKVVGHRNSLMLFERT